MQDFAGDYSTFTTSHRVTRREMLAASVAIPFVSCRATSAQTATSPLIGQVGITTSSLSGHIAAKSESGKIGVLDLPKVVRNELDMKVIDLNTSTIASLSGGQLDQFRKAAADAGCILTNLKMNQRGLDLASPDSDKRTHALSVYKKSIDVAAQLGLKWARPLPLSVRPDLKLYVDAYRRLADYGAARKVGMLVENFGWLDKEPGLTVKVLDLIGSNVAASPDTGNWANNTVRYAGLKQTFPRAVTCDFKARTLGPKGEHPLYDLKRCFMIGHAAKFRGPWCLEHANRDRKLLFKELALLRDMLRGWMTEVAKNDPSTD